jgi:hypothetical protein
MPRGGCLPNVLKESKGAEPCANEASRGPINLFLGIMWRAGANFAKPDAGPVE